MNVAKALVWIDLYKSAYGHAPTTYGQSDKWLLKAGELCKDRFIRRDDTVPVTDKLIRRALGIAPLPKDAII